VQITDELNAQAGGVSFKTHLPSIAGTLQNAVFHCAMVSYKKMLLLFEQIRCRRYESAAFGLQFHMAEKLTFQKQRLFRRFLTVAESAY
jgi:hypothetical protein